MLTRIEPIRTRTWNDLSHKEKDKDKGRVCKDNDEDKDLIYNDL